LSTQHARVSVASASGPAALEEAAAQLFSSTGNGLSKAAARAAIKETGGHVLRIAGGAAAHSLVTNGAVCTVEGISAYLAGERSARDAALHVVRVSSTSAISVGVGAITAAVFVALTGPAGIPAIKLIWAGAAMACRLGMRSRPS
jgi:hypothetical protein